MGFEGQAGAYRQIRLRKAGEGMAIPLCGMACAKAQRHKIVHELLGLERLESAMWQGEAGC